MPDVSYDAIISIDGLSVPYSSIDISPEMLNNINQPLKPVGPVESYTGPMRISGTITLPMYGTGAGSVVFFKKLCVSTTGHDLLVYYGVNGRIESYIVAIKSATFTCTPGSYLSCTLNVIGFRLDYLNSFSSRYTLNDVAVNSLIPFFRTSIANNHYPYIDSNKVSGWSLTIERQWEEYWYWNYTLDDFLLRLPQYLMPSNIGVSGSFTLIDPAPVAEYSSILFNMGQYFSDNNFIEAHKTQIIGMPSPITGPHNRIVQNIKFITLSNGSDGYIDGQFNGLIS